VIEIRNIVEWFKSYGSNTGDINTLLEKQGQLAGYSFYLAEFVGAKHKEFITLEHTRKVEYNQDINTRITAGGSKGASEVAAFLTTAELRIKEKVAEMLYQESKLQLQQVNKVIEAMTMRISYLKKEVEQSKKMV
jgi:hypothetical protein